jgi:hypothetical protein
MNDQTFVTSSLPLAAYLTATGNLSFREVRLTDPRRAVFVFSDPEGRGPELERKFEAGAVVSALAFHTQLRILRRAIDNEIQTAGLGVNRRDHIQGKYHVHFSDQR